ncbi:MAG: TonB-dependent receptor, partial [FCB group bacterium]|nr:TonB-dependent receptor [FCB group bacterium]
MAGTRCTTQRNTESGTPAIISRILSFLLLSLLPAQNSRLTGFVRNADTGAPVTYANVLVLNTQTGAITDSTGRFILQPNVSPPLRLIVSHIGYETAYFNVTEKNRNSLTIPLEESFFQMDRVVVTATRTPKIFRNVPVATEVITRQDIRDSGALNVGDLLNQRSGVNVTSSVDGGSVVNVLGMDSKYVLILQDGQPLSGKFNGRVALDQIPTSSLQKVEILKGPSSALYGSEAMGGVINLVSDTTRRVSTLEFVSRYSAEGNGSFTPWDFTTGKHTAQIAWSLNRRPFSFRLDGDIRQINVDKSILYIDVDDMIKSSLRGWFTWKLARTLKLTVDNTWFQDLESSHSATMNAATIIQRNQTNLILRVDPGARWVIDNTLRWATYSRRYDQVRPWGDVFRRDTTRENALEVEIAARREGERNALNLGLELSQDTYSSDRIASYSRQEITTSFYGQTEVYLSPRQTLIAGLRLDRTTGDEWVLSPRIGGMVSLGERWKFRTTLGTGYRRPTFMDRYIDWNHI